MGVGAWLLGVGAATAGSLLAVSLLGQGIAPATSQQVSPATVTQALANETDEPAPQTASLPAPTRSAAHRHSFADPLRPATGRASNRWRGCERHSCDLRVLQLRRAPFQSATRLTAAFHAAAA